MPSVGPGADPGVQAVSPQVTVSHPPGGRLPYFPPGRFSRLYTAHNRVAAIKVDFIKYDWRRRLGAADGGL